MPLSGRRICLAVTGSIAAYKAVLLLRLLVKQGAEVQVILTSGAERFVSAITFQALSSRPVRTDLWDQSAEAAMSHIELAKWADSIIIAPASAHCIAKLALGLADDLLSTVCLASQAHLVIAPAMNQQMYAHPALQSNLDVLKARGVEVIAPAAGFQACGDTEQGRMVEPDEILAVLLNTMPQTLKGLRLLLTAGPTIEPIDPVRFISNHSSGKMGYALAEQAVNLGAKVTLITGPTSLPVPIGVEAIDVRTALEMHTEVMQRVNQCDLFIAVAAVADYRAESISMQKIKKSADEMLLKMRRNPDIVQSVCALDDKPYVVAFAAETENVLDNARKKRQQKGADMMVANQVGEKLVFNQDLSSVILITEETEKEILNQSKQNIAKTILASVAEKMSISVLDQ